ncbi:YidH family protein [Halothiobacillus sp. DCM-1]|uniref:YidH family protein n=1 Tax=Halothiobacillus sp. DCM-1 TaxID=3112558 RepID=UPI003248540E
MSDLNDPRVFFAAERTLLAWNRTGLTLMAFGFVIERFDLFVSMLAKVPGTPLGHAVSFTIGLAFIVLGASVSGLAILQYRKVLRTLNASEIPLGYWVNQGVLTNLAVALLGFALTVYLFTGRS